MRIITATAVCRVVGRTLDPTGANTISDASTLLVITTLRVCRARPRQLEKATFGVTVSVTRALRFGQKETDSTGRALKFLDVWAASASCCNAIGAYALAEAPANRVGCFSASSLSYPALGFAVCMTLAHIAV